MLSPFEVSSETDRGYQPTAVLQGGRGCIELADVAGQVAVFTREFMEDVGITSQDEAFLFSATTATCYDNVNGNADNRPGSRNNADDSMNSRGLGSLDRTRNFSPAAQANPLHADRAAPPGACSSTPTISSTRLGST